MCARIHGGGLGSVGSFLRVCWRIRATLNPLDSEFGEDTQSRAGRTNSLSTALGVRNTWKLFQMASPHPKVR